MAKAGDFYVDVLQKVFAKAQEVALVMSGYLDKPEARKLLCFVCRHGYVGFSCGQKDKFAIGSWLDPERSGQPAPEEAKRAIAVISCKAKDVVPIVGQVRRRRGNAFSATGGFTHNHCVVLTYCDKMSILELALTLLHELRHARHVYAGDYGLMPLDPAQPSSLHEALTWSAQFEQMDMCCGDAWEEAVRREIDCLKCQCDVSRLGNGRPLYLSSGNYHLELDAAFGATANQAVKGSRTTLCSARANVVLAQGLGVDRHAACLNLVQGLAKTRLSL